MNKWRKDVRSVGDYVGKNVGQNAGASVFGKIKSIDPTVARYTKYKAIFKAGLNPMQKQQLDSILDTQKELLSPNTTMWKSIALRARLNKERSTLRKSLTEAQADQFTKVNRLSASVLKNEAAFIKAGQKIATNSTTFISNKL